jgi:hypothetical protein
MPGDARGWFDEGIPSPVYLRKVFKVGALSPDFGGRKWKKSYKNGIVSAKYS